MNKERVEELKKQELERIENERKEVRSLFEYFINNKNLKGEAYENMYNAYEYFKKNSYWVRVSLTISMFNIDIEQKYIISDEDKKKLKRIERLIENLDNLYDSNKVNVGYLDNLLDMTFEFNGDLVITDPCYIEKERKSDEPSPAYSDYVKPLSDYDDMVEFERLDVAGTDKEQYCVMFNNGKYCYSEKYRKDKERLAKANDDWYDRNADDFEKHWDDLTPLGFTTYYMRDTLYGDWSCHVFNVDTEEPVGRFCADGGMVGVFYLSDIEKYNPEFYNDIKGNDKHYAAVIRNFCGEVIFEVKEVRGAKYFNYELEIRFDGINNKTGEKINYVAKQTGL